MSITNYKMLATRNDVARAFVAKNPAIVGTVVLMSETHSWKDEDGQPVDGEDQKLNSEIIRSYIRQLRATNPDLNTILVEDGFAEMMEMTRTMNRQNEYGIFLQSGHIDIFMSMEVITSLMEFSRGDYEAAFSNMRRLWVICQKVKEDPNIPLDTSTLIPDNFNAIVTFEQKFRFMLRMVRQNSSGKCYLVQWLQDFSDNYRTGNSYANRWFIAMLSKINVYSLKTLRELSDQIDIVREHYMCEYAVNVSQGFDIVFIIVGHSHWHTMRARMMLESEQKRVEMFCAVPLSFYGVKGEDFEVDAGAKRMMSEILAGLIADDENIQWTSYLRPLQNGARLRF